MGPLAEIARARGARVSGSDAAPSPALDRLRSLGIEARVGHAAGNLAAEAGLVVVSSAIRNDNAELVEALRRGVPVLHRAEYLRALMSAASRRVVVAGSHGKTTTTGMVTHILAESGADPTAVVGGKLRRENSGARIGSADLFVAEADESDRSFLRLEPTHLVVTNVDREHVDVYRDQEDVEDAFVDFVDRAPRYGRAIVCADDAGAARVFARSAGRAGRSRASLWTYGFAGDATVSGRVVSRFDGRALLEGETPLGPFRTLLPVAGDMNAQNAIGAIAVSTSLGVAPRLAARALATFESVGRRLEHKGERAGVAVFDDYGHHPTEIRATLQALRARVPGRRLVVAFQPHRYTRTQALWDDFKGCFEEADALLLIEIYAASEDPIPGVSSERLAREIAGARYLGPVDRARDRIADELKPGDVLLTLGAGNVVDVGESYLGMGPGRAA
jgi:UDP-N-acetylmuramate--alanine ligase